MINLLKKKAEQVAKFFWNVLAVWGVIAIYFVSIWMNEGVVVYFEKDGDMKLASSTTAKK